MALPPSGMKICRLPARWPITKPKRTRPVRAMTAFLPIVDCQSRRSQVMDGCEQTLIASKRAVGKELGGRRKLAGCHGNSEARKRRPGGTDESEIHSVVPCFRGVRRICEGYFFSSF